MTDQQLFFVVLGVFYLWECLSWLPRQNQILARGLLGEWRVLAPLRVLSNKRGAVVFEPLFPWGSALAIASQFPIVPCRNGYAILDSNGVARAYHPWPEVDWVETNGAKLILSDGPSWTTAHPMVAKRQRRQLEAIRSADAESRAGLISDVLEREYDRTAIQARWDEVARDVCWLGNLASILFLFLFFLCAPATWFWSLQTLWLPIFVLLFGQTVLLAVWFYRAHRRLAPNDSDERFKRTLLIALYPPAAMRAPVTLSRNLWHAFSPDGLAAVFLCSKHWHQRFEVKLRGLAYPCFRSRLAAKERHDISESLERIKRQLLRIAHERGMQWLDQPPQRESTECRAYCPRCLGQFTTERPTCSDCSEVPLKSWPVVD